MLDRPADDFSREPFIDLPAEWGIRSAFEVQAQRIEQHVVSSAIHSPAPFEAIAVPEAHRPGGGGYTARSRSGL